jgi:hypothetical protein
MLRDNVDQYAGWMMDIAEGERDACLVALQLLSRGRHAGLSPSADGRRNRKAGTMLNLTVAAIDRDPPVGPEQGDP